MSEPEQSGMRHPIWPSLSGAGWLWLITATIVTALISLGVHDVMLTRMGIPFPDTTAVPGWARYVDTAVRLGSLVWFCRLAAPQMGHFSRMRAALLVGVLLVLLSETLRVLAVGIYLTEGWVAGRWLFLLLDRIPGAVMGLFLGAAAVLIARARRLTRPAPAGMVILLASGGTMLLLSGMRTAATAVQHWFLLTEPVERYQLPYPLHVYSVIYSTFIEPTIATLVLVALVWPSLSGSSFRRVLAFAGLLLLVRGRIVTQFLFSFWIPLPFGRALLSEGQFCLETLTLALLSGTICYVAVGYGVKDQQPTRVSIEDADARRT